MEHSVLVSLIAEGLSTHKIAARLNTSQTNVRHWLEKYGLKTSPTPRAKKVISWRQRTKQRAVAYKGGKCVKCGYSRCIRALKFHHLDPTQKDFTIAGKSMSWSRIKAEVDKCILVCGNCHDEIHESWQNGDIVGIKASAQLACNEVKMKIAFAEIDENNNISIVTEKSEEREFPVLPKVGDVIHYKGKIGARGKVTAVEHDYRCSEYTAIVVVQPDTGMQPDASDYLIFV